VETYSKLGGPPDGDIIFRMLGFAVGVFLLQKRLE
jgi:hypothetical protein